MWIQVLDEYNEPHYINLAQVEDFETIEKNTHIHMISGRMVVCQDDITSALQKIMQFSGELIKVVRS